MESNSKASRAGGLLLLLVIVIAIAAVLLYFFEYIAMGALIAALVIIGIFALILIVGVLLIIPMYIMKDTTVEAGSYDISSNDAVGNEEGEGQDSYRDR